MNVHILQIAHFEIIIHYSKKSLGRWYNKFHWVVTIITGLFTFFNGSELRVKAPQVLIQTCSDRKFQVLIENRMRSLW